MADKARGGKICLIAGEPGALPRATIFRPDGAPSRRASRGRVVDRLRSAWDRLGPDKIFSPHTKRGEKETLALTPASPPGEAGASRPRLVGLDSRAQYRCVGYPQCRIGSAPTIVGGYGLKRSSQRDDPTLGKGVLPDWQRSDFTRQEYWIRGNTRTLRRQYAARKRVIVRVLPGIAGYCRVVGPWEKVDGWELMVDSRNKTRPHPSSPPGEVGASQQCWSTPILGRNTAAWVVPDEE